MKLAELQRTFWSMTTQRRFSDAQQTFVSTTALSASRRMSIYADMFWWRQVDSLREDFPKLAVVHEDFRALAQAYLTRHPSRHPSLARLGVHMAAFVAERSELSALAALEWARAEVFEEADVAVVSQPTFSEPLRFVPALRILSLTHDAAAVWQSIEDGRSVPSFMRTSNTVVVWRKGFEVFHVRLGDAEACALARARNNESIEAICEAFEHEPAPIDAAMRAVGSWFAEGWVASSGEHT